MSGYDAYGGGGGGFLQDSYGQAQGGGYGGGSGAKKEKGAGQTVHTIPVTIKQLLAAQSTPGGDAPLIDNLPAKSVRIVGRIVSINDDMTKADVTVTDGTGSLLLSEYTASTHWATTRATLGVGVYVNAVLKVTIQGGHGLTVQISGIRPISDPNSITHHYLSVIETHLAATRAQPNKLTPAGAGAGAGAASNPYGAGAGGYMNPAQAAQMAYGGGGFSASSSQHGAMGRTVHDEIKEVIRALAQQVDPGVGVMVDDIWAHIGPKNIMSKGELQETLQSMCLDGAVFTCSDENHYMLSE